MGAALYVVGGSDVSDISDLSEFLWGAIRALAGTGTAGDSLRGGGALAGINVTVSVDWEVDGSTLFAKV